MLTTEVQSTMNSVAALIATVDDSKAQRICWVIAGMLERSLSENARLESRLAEVEADNKGLRAKNIALRTSVDQLKEQVSYLNRQLYGKKSEANPDKKAPTAPPLTPAELAKVAEARELQKQARALIREANAVVAKQKAQASKLVHELVRRRVPEGLVCFCCAGGVKDRGMAHTAHEIDIVPATLIDRTFLLHRGSCDCGAVDFVMPDPDRGLEQTTASPQLIAKCAVDKFLYHMPIHRQEAYFKQRGCDLSRSTINGWVLRGALVCEPLWKALCQANRLEPIKLCDETPICVVKDHESKDRFLWCIVTMLAVTFDVTTERNIKIAAQILGSIGEATLTDGHGCYSKKSIAGAHANCLGHARRKFFDSVVAFPTESMAVLGVIRDIFMVERLADELGLDPAGRLELRKTKSAPLLVDLQALISTMNPPPKSSLGKAINYLTKRWAKLTHFLADGRIPLTTNEVERRFRDAKLGFKNFLFAQSEVGVDAVAIYYTLIATARLYGHDPNDYLADVMVKITNGLPNKRLHELFPWNWQPPPKVEQELPPMSREEHVPIERILNMRSLAGKVRAAAPSSPESAIKNAAAK